MNNNYCYCCPPHGHNMATKEPESKEIKISYLQEPLTRTKRNSLIWAQDCNFTPCFCTILSLDLVEHKCSKDTKHSRPRKLFLMVKLSTHLWITALGTESSKAVFAKPLHNPPPPTPGNNCFMLCQHCSVSAYLQMQFEHNGIKLTVRQISKKELSLGL